MAIDTTLLNQTVEIATLSTTTNNYGAVSHSFATTGSFSCNFQPRTFAGDESPDDGSIIAEQTYLLVVEPTTALNVTDRVLVAGQLYNVISQGMLPDIEDGSNHHREAICRLVL